MCVYACVSVRLCASVLFWLLFACVLRKHFAFAVVIAVDVLVEIEHGSGT